VTTLPARKPTLRFGNAEAIKSYRSKHRLNQSDFWPPIGVTQSAGSRYESGRNIPKPVQILLQLTYGTPKQAGEMLAWLRNEE